MKRNTLITLILILIIGGLVVYLAAYKPKISDDISDEITTPIPVVKNPTSQPVPALSADKKLITLNGEVLLSIDDDAIFNFFKDDATGMCDKNNIDNTPTRKDFCTTKSAFTEQARFSKIVSSASKNKIGFVIETDELAPDTTVGILYPQNTTYKVHMLTSYYLGNDFLGFSPNDTYLVYKGGCFEGQCGFSIKNATTLKDIKSFGDPESGPSVTFIRWVSDNEIEYKEGEVVKQAKI